MSQECVTQLVLTQIKYTCAKLRSSRTSLEGKAVYLNSKTLAQSSAESFSSY